MKFVYLGNFRHSWTTESWIAHALESLDCGVVRTQEGREVIPLLEEAKPDVFLFCKARKTHNLREVLKYCREHDIVSVSWSFDLYFMAGRSKTVRDAMFSADIVCTTDRGHNDIWGKNGINHHVLRQGIHEPEAKLGEPYEMNAEIIFVGSDNPAWPTRKMLMKHLRYNYRNKFEWLGKRKDQQIRGTDLNNLFASVKIVIGDSVYSPDYWSNRVYETLGRGGFFLHPRVEGLDEEFEYYKHLVPYDLEDYGQIDSIIDYYLEHDEEREKIRLAGHEYCKENYTYKDRCKKLIKLINEEERSLERRN